MAQKFQLVTTSRKSGYSGYFPLNSKLPFLLCHFLEGRNGSPFYLRLGLALDFSFGQIYLKVTTYIEKCPNPTHELKLPTKRINSDDPKLNLGLLLEWLDSCRLES